MTRAFSFPTSLGQFTCVLNESKINLLLPNRENWKLEGIEVNYLNYLDGKLLELANFIEGKSLHLNFVPEQPGTDFEKNVWNEIVNVPRGQTISYKQIAVKLGLPNHARAVARACGRNNIAIVVPCHRVIKSDGSLSGYRWGQELKQKLLEREK